MEIALVSNIITIALRVQVPNYDIHSNIVTYITTIPNPKP